jgi:hypothetical protein
MLGEHGAYQLLYNYACRIVESSSCDSSNRQERMVTRAVGLARKGQSRACYRQYGHRSRHDRELPVATMHFPRQVVTGIR